MTVAKGGHTVAESSPLNDSYTIVPRQEEKMLVKGRCAVAESVVVDDSYALAEFVLVINGCTMARVDTGRT